MTTVRRILVSLVTERIERGEPRARIVSSARGEGFDLNDSRRDDYDERF